MPVTSDNQEYLQLSKLVPLNTLAEDELDRLLLKVDVEKVKKGGILFREGDVDHVNVYLLSGRIGLFSGSSQVDLLEDDSATSRFPVAHQLPRKFSAKALTGLTIVRIDSRILSESLAKNETATVEDVQIEEDHEDADWMSQLLQSPVMQNIPAANLQGVMMRMQEMPVNEDDVIIQEGDEGDYYYLMNKGQAVVLKLNEDKTENIEIVRLNAGASFGEDALLSDSPRGSTVKMLTDGLLLRLSKEDFIELIRHPLSETVSSEAALALIDKGAFWVDVREPEVFEASHVPGAINMPYHSLRFQIPSLASDKHYVIISQSGTKSIASAYLFLERGLQVSILDGGYNNFQYQENGSESEPDSELELDSETIDLPDERQVSTDIHNKELAELKEQLLSKDKLLEEALAKLEEVNNADSDSVDSSEFTALKKQYQKLEREVIGLSEQLESEEEVYDKLKLQYDSLSAENKKHLQLRDADLASLKESLTVLQLDKDQIESDYEELLEQSQAGASNKDLDANNNEELTRSLNQVSELEGLNASIAEDRDSLKYELEEIRNELSLVNQENSELQLEITDLKDRIAELSNRS